MINLGLLGKNIKHSNSKIVYEKLLKHSINYQLFDYKQASGIPSLNNLFSDIVGLSITSPYKKHFLQNVIIDNKVKKLPAINCIKKDGEKFIATNTDYFAIIEIIKDFELSHTKLKFIILGDGVMSDVTQIILDELKFNYEVLSRKNNKNFYSVKFNQKNFGSIEKIILINTCAREYSFTNDIDPQFIFWDYNYNLDHHLNGVAVRVNQYVDGNSMLLTQARYALEFWGRPNS